MSVAIKKIEGVEQVEVSLAKASALITLRPDNHVTLPQLRRTIRNSGYPTRDAQITARGSLTKRDGKPMLDLLNGTAIELAASPTDGAGGIVEVTGTSREGEKKVERLTIATVKRQPERLSSQ